MTYWRLSVTLALVSGVATAQSPRFAQGEWNAYGRDALGSRFSPLTQITRDNVGRLAVAWTYRTGESERARHGSRPSSRRRR